jgi:hypothetical protein
MNLLSNWHRGSSLEVKQPWREAKHWSAFSADVKNAWSYASITTHVCMVWCFGKYEGNVSFALSAFLSEEVKKKAEYVQFYGPYE